MTHHKHPTFDKVYILKSSYVKSKHSEQKSENVIKDLLSEYFNLPYDEITIERTSEGKPYCPNIDIAFNLSHSGSMLFSAFSTSGEEIGCDIQKCNRPEKMKEIAQYYFMQDELQFIRENGINLFLFWTLKEAYIKYLGRSIFDIHSLGSILPFIDNFESFTFLEGSDRYYLSIYPRKGRTFIDSPYSLQPVQLYMQP